MVMSEISVSTSRGQKRKRCEEQWQINVAKASLNQGLEYISHASSRKHVPAHVVGMQCRDGCFTKVTEAGVSEIFKAF